MADEKERDTVVSTGDVPEDPLPPVLQQTDNVLIENLEYPWEDVEDTKPTDLEYELFCGALESFWSKPIDELVDDWTISLETVLPAIRSSIRMYSKAASSEEEVSEMDVELARWVEFGLSSSQSTSYADSSRMVMIGCSLVKQLSSMHEKQLSTAFYDPRYLQYIMDIILSSRYCSSVRCEAAQALLQILFHPSLAWNFMSMKITDNEYTPYEQIVRLFMKPEDVSLDLLTVLQKIATYFAFKYSIDAIIKSARRCLAEEEDYEIDTRQLLSSFIIVQKFFEKSRNDFSYTSHIAHQTVAQSRLIPHICALITSPNQDARLRHVVIQCLRALCDFDGTDISGAIFLSHMDTRTVSLVARLLQRATDSNKETSLLPYALRAIVLIDQLAAANEMIDAPKRVTILQNMLMMMSVDEGRRAMISALSFGDNLKHLLHICNIQKSILSSENHADDDKKMRFRQTATYGYLCEILFALARNQSDGVFWRKHGPEIIKLIDCNLISAATSLKQWLEPFRDELALGTNMSTANFLLLRLIHYSEKYVDGDPPLQLLAILRLVDAILVEPAPFADVSLDGIRFDYCTRLYEDDGLEKLTHILNVANNEQSKRVSNRCTSLSGDSYIYCQFVRSATSIVHKLLSSLQALSQNPDQTTVDTLLSSYTLCCMDETSCDSVIKDIVLRSFALFISPTVTERRKSRETNQRSFLELFLDTGFEKPSNFFAVLDILRQLLPIPSSSLVNIAAIDTETANSMETLWSDAILKCEKQLQFAISLGIASSQRLRRCLLDLCKRLAYFSRSIAQCLAYILVKLSLRMLTVSAYTAIVDVFDEEAFEEEESNVRLATAVDLATSSFYAFMAACSADLILRNAVVVAISERTNYIPTLLKFFKLASPKTAPHVSFQAHVIKIFRNLCVVDIESDGEVAYLPRDTYTTICNNLVEHFGNVELDVETAVLALKSVYDIGRLSAFGNAVVEKAVIGNEGAVLRFLDRLNSMGEANEKLLVEAGTLLAGLLENIVKKESNKSAVLKSQTSADSEEHPLLRLKTKLMEHGCPEHVMRSLQKAFEVTTKVEPVKDDLDKSEANEWPQNTTTVQQVNSQQATNYHVPDLLNLNDEDREDFHYNAPLSTVDLSMLNEEFFSGTALPSANESPPPTRPQNLASVAPKVQRWKPFASEGARRKRSYVVPKTRPPAVRPKVRRF